MKRILIACLALLLVSCESNKRKIQWYEQTTSNDSGMEEVIYWYLIYNDSGSVSYCESSTRLTSFSNVTWTVSQGTPNGFVASSATQKGEMETELTDEQIDSIDQQTKATTEAESDADTDSSEGSSDSESSSSDGDSGGGGDSGDGGGGDGGGE